MPRLFTVLKEILIDRRIDRRDRSPGVVVPVRKARDGLPVGDTQVARSSLRSQ